MSKQTNLYVTQKVRNPQVQILQADAAAMKLLYTGSADDAIMKALTVTSTDSVARVVQLVIEDPSGNQRVLGSATVAAFAGTNGVAPSVDLLSAALNPGLVMDQNGKRTLPVEAGYKVKVKSTGAVTATTSLDFNATVEEY